MTDIPEFKDKTISCVDCGQDFIFVAGEQRYFWSKCLSEPKRCKDCRMIRRRNIVTAQEGNNNDKG